MSSAPAPSADGLTIRPVSSKADKKAFVELAYRLNLADPKWVPELKMEERGLITPGKNPWFEHGEAQFFLAWRDGRSEGSGAGHGAFLIPVSGGMKRCCGASAIAGSQPQPRSSRA